MIRKKGYYNKVKSRGKGGKHQFEQNKQRYNQLEEGFWENPIFELFYKEVLKEYFLEDKEDEEWKRFWQSMQDKLFITLRVSALKNNSSLFMDKLKSKEFIQQLYKKQLTDLEKQHKDKVQQEKQYQEKNKGTDKEKTEDEQKQILENLDVEYNNKQTELDELMKKFAITEIPWCKDVFEISIDSHYFSKKFKAFNTILNQANENGIITRQELVSMLPPIILDPQPGDNVLDVCAAPGSKTVQLIELMYENAQKQNIPVTGSVVSNELNTDRSYILSHRLNRNGGSQTSLVVNHQAQFMPQYLNQEGNEPFQFDRVLADVPCTGDGAARKITGKWQDWTCKDAFMLWPVQLTILLKSIQVTKVGGYVLYSTCSINPLEDESVVLEAFRQCIPGSLELIDCHNIKDFKGRKGLLEWKILLNKITKKNVEKEDLKTLEAKDIFEEAESFKQAQQKQEEDGKSAGQIGYTLLKQGMWPESKEFLETIQMQNTSRVLSHDQNTGGFYVALLRKRQTTQLSEEQKKQEFNPQQYLEEYKKNIKLDIGTIKETEYLKKPVEQKIEQDLNQILNFDTNKQQQTQLSNLQKKDIRILNEKEEALKKKEPRMEEELKLDDFKPKKQQKKEYNQYFERYEFMTQSEFEQLQSQFGIQNVDKNQFVCSIKGFIRKFKFISKGLAQLLASDSNRDQLHAINIGVKVFQREASENNFRLNQDGAQELLPYITKRKIYTDFKTLLSLIGKTKIEYTDIENKQFLKDIEECGKGSAIVVAKPDGEKYKQEECLAMLIFNTSIQPMVSKEKLQGLSILYDLKL